MLMENTASDVLKIHATGCISVVEKLRRSYHDIVIGKLGIIKMECACTSQMMSNDTVKCFFTVILA